MPAKSKKVSVETLTQELKTLSLQQRNQPAQSAYAMGDFKFCDAKQRKAERQARQAAERQQEQQAKKQAEKKKEEKPLELSEGDWHNILVKGRGPQKEEEKKKKKKKNQARRKATQKEVGSKYWW
ncbi:troponin T, cardiac muscle isoforms-like [Penaeus japonicus]|uniref:troponin T, cardiac muscle isoforms-like n=1 Tax=Penaeus japonicus TaxID=27405 RepID=UPI001C70E041|nr:troponin T, cardiac muscle isoforms-like [Penaeus japonicus]